jgi:hypothetical protein
VGNCDCASAPPAQRSSCDSQAVPIQRSEQAATRPATPTRAGAELRHCQITTCAAERCEKAELRIERLRQPRTLMTPAQRARLRRTTPWPRNGRAATPATHAPVRGASDACHSRSSWTATIAELMNCDITSDANTRAAGRAATTRSSIAATLSHTTSCAVVVLRRSTCRRTATPIRQRQHQRDGVTTG